MSYSYKPRVKIDNISPLNFTQKCVCTSRGCKIQFDYFYRCDIVFCLHRDYYFGKYITDIDEILQLRFNSDNNEDFLKSQHVFSHLEIKPKIPEKLNCYFVDYYHSTKYFNDYELNDSQKAFRRLVWDFKNGYSDATNTVANMISYMINIILGNNKQNWMFIPIPASTKQKTENRFKKFCELISKNTGVLNGYGCIYNIKDRIELKDGEENKIKIKTLDDFNKYNDINVNEVTGKNIILFDDVITVGNSFALSVYKLKECGVNNIIGIFLGKDKYKYKKS